MELYDTNEQQKQLVLIRLWQEIMSLTHELFQTGTLSLIDCEIFTAVLQNTADKSCLKILVSHKALQLYDLWIWHAKHFSFFLPVIQKHNFPINYTIRVHHNEVFKLSNISRMVRVMILSLDLLTPFLFPGHGGGESSDDAFHVPS